TVLITGNHLQQLIFCIVVCLLIFPLYSPVYWNLRPYQDAQFIGQANHIFIVWVMCQTYIVTAQFLCPSKQYTGIFSRICSATPKWIFFMYTDTSEEYRFPVYKDIPSFHRYGSEANPVFKCMSVVRQVYIIEEGLPGIPVLQFSGFY